MVSLGLALVLLAQPPQVGGSRSDAFLPTGQRIRPAGRLMEFNQRPMDAVVRADGTVLVKTHRSVRRIDPAAGRELGSLDVPNGTSITGLATLPDGRFAVSDARSAVHFGEVGPDGKLSWQRNTTFPNAAAGGPAYPCGLAALPDGRLLVALSRSNQLVWLDANGAIIRTIDVDVAPTAIGLSPDSRTAFVACWSRRARSGDATAPSSGTAVPVGPGGGAHDAQVWAVDVATGVVRRRTPVGPQPVAFATHPDGRVFVASASAGRIDVLEGATGRKLRSVAVSPVTGGDHQSSAPNGLGIDAAKQRLYVACGGTNQVAVLGTGGGIERLMGAIPAAWYPSSVALSGGRLVIANAKGYGSRAKPAGRLGHGVFDFTGVVQIVDDPTPRTIMTAPFTSPRLAPARKNRAPVPVPERVGEPSVFEHVVLVIKENRTYDQVFGDLPQGNGEPKLCIFGRPITPNHHALAEEFGLLDNFYCNGVLSADGHAWATEGTATTFFERSFGGWTRSYPFGDDPLAVASTGYIWDPILEKGKTVRNFGEFDYAAPVPANATYKQIYDDFVSGANAIRFTQNIGVARLRALSDPNTPGWNMRIPDVLRADRFIKDLARMEASNAMPNLTILYYPQDHTSGTTPGEPTPQACVADNDLALGRVVEAISKSRFWPKTAIFVMEDDPQAGFDHVDGHRTVGMVISPYSRGLGTVSAFYDQSSMRATILRILGLAPQTHFDATAPLMSACFGPSADYRPYVARTNEAPLDELNPPRSAMTPFQQKMADLSATLDLRGPDRIPEDTLNRIVWHAQRGETEYPSAWAGAHGRGLPAGLKIQPMETDDDD